MVSPSILLFSTTAFALQAPRLGNQLRNNDTFQGGMKVGGWSPIIKSEWKTGKEFSAEDVKDWVGNVYCGICTDQYNRELVLRDEKYRRSDPPRSYPPSEWLPAKPPKNSSILLADNEDEGPTGDFLLKLDPVTNSPVSIVSEAKKTIFKKFCEMEAVLPNTLREHFSLFLLELQATFDTHPHLGCRGCSLIRRIANSFQLVRFIEASKATNWVNCCAWSSHRKITNRGTCPWAGWRGQIFNGWVFALTKT
mmetsp:Transcript_37571/g.69268  ORF Transcript_37571/g.69268 Transcript_37571/m.69268 type:complete len:251 (-) Transcript_37571:585-1337(-)